MVNLKDVENYLPMPEVKMPKMEDALLNNLVGFVMWLKENRVRVGFENCERGYVVFVDLPEFEIREGAERYLKELSNEGQ